MKPRNLFSLVAMLWVPLVVLAETDVPAVLPVPELIAALQSGGHIIYMRHGQTDHTQKDRNRSQWGNCEEQRNLSEAGREQIKQIGQAIKALEIPIGKVFSSPYCRCVDTAKLGFGALEVVSDLQFSFSKDEVESRHLGKKLHELMMDRPREGKNSVFVGHSSNLRDGLGVWPKPEGVIAVFKNTEGSIVYRGMIKPDEWPLR